MFELSKMESPEFALCKQHTDVCEFLRQQIVEMIPQLDQAGYTYECRIPQRDIVADIDTSHMRRVFQNLISNTIRHTPKGTHIVIMLSDDSGDIKITYQDNGGGIPSEIKDSLFNPFVRADASRHTEGTGLGLAIVKKIISAHDGSIYLDCSVGHGCSFVITLKKLR
jgi:signal transduction histidine kinase